MDDCPSREELLEFTTGRLSELAAEAVAEHLADCAACREALAELDGITDPFIEALRNSQSAPLLDPADCQWAVDCVIDLNLRG